MITSMAHLSSTPESSAETGSEPGVRVGQPGVHGEQARLGAEADDDEREREAHEHRVELVGVGHDGGEEGGLMRVGHDIGGVRVDEQRAEQAEGHTGGADIAYFQDASSACLFL